MKLSPSVRMKLAHRLAQRDSWIIGTKTGAARNLNSYKDLLAACLRNVNLEVTNITNLLIDFNERILNDKFTVARETDIALANFGRKREQRMRSVAVRQKGLDEKIARFEAARALYVEIFGEVTEADKRKVRDAIPENERLDDFIFGICNLRHDGHHLLAVLAVIAEQWVYVKPCCNCGSKHGCDCGCECEHYGDTCGCCDY